MGKERKLSLRHAAETCALDFTITYSDGSEEKIWVRTLTEPELREVEELQAEQMRKVRAWYAPDSARYAEIKAMIDMEPASSSIPVVIESERAELAKKAAKRVARPMPLDDSKCRNDADREKLMAKHWEMIEERERQIDTICESIVSDREEQLKALPIAELREMHLALALRSAVYTEAAMYSNALKIMYSIYDGENHDERYFESPADVLALPMSVKEYLLSLVSKVDQVTPFDIKNSQGRSGLGIGPAENTPEATTESSTTDSPASGSRKKRSRGGFSQSSTA